MKTTFLFKFYFLKFTSKQKKLLIDSVSLFPCLFALMMFKSLVEIKIESRLHCINIYDEDFFCKFVTQCSWIKKIQITQVLIFFLTIMYC